MNNTKIDDSISKQQDISNNSNPIELNSMTYTTSNYFMLDTLMSGCVSIEQLKNYIRYPMKYNNILRRLSREAYNSSGLYGNVIDYMMTIPTLDFITTCLENTSANKKKKKIFNKVLKKLNHKMTTRDILMNCFIDGMYVGILRDTKPTNTKIDLTLMDVENIDYLEGLSTTNNFMIQPLNLNYCKFIGVENGLPKVAFNMMYFDQFKHGGLVSEIKNYPVEFVKAYNDYKKDGTKQWFALDSNKTISLKFKSNLLEPYGRPLGLSALFDIRFAEDYINSQIATVNDLASSIYYMILPEGEKAGSCSLNKEQQENIRSAFEGAVSLSSSNRSGGTKISKLTLAPGTTIDKLPKDASLLKDTLNEENIKKISTSLGFASGALNASSEGGASYASLQVNIDLVMCQIFAVVEQIANEYTRVLNYWMNPKNSEEIVKLSYLRTSTLNQQRQYDMAKDLFTYAGGTHTHLIASAGYDVEDYIATKKMEKEENFEDLFTPNQTSFTQSGKDDVGADPKDTSQLTPSGISNRTNGSNVKKNQ